MYKKFLAIALTCSAMSAFALIPAYAEEASTEASVETVALSDDPYSFQMELDGDLYEFPMTFEAFVALGWEVSADLDEQLEPNTYSMATAQKGDLQVYIYPLNLGINSLPLSACDIAGIDIDSYYMEKASDTSIVLPGGITYGVSTLDDITAAYGPASDTYEGDLYTQLSYQYDYYQELEINVDKESGVLSDIKIENIDSAKSATANAEAVVSSEAPESVLSYEAPTELGDDFLSFTAEYAGDLYKLPCPLSALLENGWTLKNDSVEMVAGKSTGRISLMKDNQEYRAFAKNYEDYALTVENCFITSLKSDIYTTDLSMTIQKGITMGMSEEDLLSALEGTDYEVDSSDSFTYYKIKSEESSLDGIEITVKKEEATVMSIELEYAPRSLD